MRIGSSARRISLCYSKATNELKKTIKAYQKVDLLILDEWQIRCLMTDESCNLFEIIEARIKHGSTIFCTQFETEGWYKRVNLDLENGFTPALRTAKTVEKCQRSLEGDR